MYSSSTRIMNVSRFLLFHEYIKVPSVSWMHQCSFCIMNVSSLDFCIMNASMFLLYHECIKSRLLYHECIKVPLVSWMYPGSSYILNECRFCFASLYRDLLWFRWTVRSNELILLKIERPFFLYLLYVMLRDLFTNIERTTLCARTFH